MSKLKIFLITVAFAFLLVFSECIYIFNNSDELSIHTIKLAECLVNFGYPKIAFRSLTISSNILYDRNKEGFVFDSLKHNKIFIDDDGFFNILNDYIKSLPSNISDLRGKYDLVRVFYELSLLAYDAGYENVFLKLMTESIGCNPTLSFPIVELSNYYFFVGNKNMAEEILSDCTKIPAARQHCMDYLNGTFLTSTPDAIGFLKSTNKYYYDSDLP